MVPESHELAFLASADLRAYLRSPDYVDEVVEKMKTQYVVDVSLQPKISETPPEQKNAEVEEGEDTSATESLILSYTRNNAGGLKDAIDFLIGKLVAHGLDASTVRGAIPRPKSDSFEDSLPFFESKLLHNAQPPNGGTDSPTRAGFGEEGAVDGQQGSFFSKFRKPGSMSSFSSLIERRKNGSNSPGSLFKHASSNASKASLASLASLESQGSGYRNPWNDSGINLPEEDNHAPTSAGLLGPHISHTSSSSSSGWPVPSAAANARFEGKPFPGLSAMTSGDTTPTTRYDPRASLASVDSGRPSTSHSFNNGIGTGLSAPVPMTGNGNGNGNGHGDAPSGPGPIGPPR